MKRKRHQVILNLIEKYDVTTQEELQKLLLENGFEVTQATVSRDIKELMLVKSLNSQGQYKYSLPSREQNGQSKFKSIFSHSAITADFAGNICVIKCYAGTANAACAAIDSIGFEGVVGTIAGDDNIFILCRTESLAEELFNTVKTMIEE